MHWLRLIGLSQGPAVLICLVLGAGSAQAQSDPFAPHVRWTHGPASQSWLPRSLAFAAEGDLLWGAGSVGSPRVMLLASNELPVETGVAPLLDQDASLVDAVGTVQVRAGADPSSLYSIHQVPVPLSPYRRTLVERRAAGAGAALSVLWTHELALVGNGAPALALDGAGVQVVAAVSDVDTGTLSIEWLDATDGSLVGARLLQAGTLRAMELSADGGRLALLAGAELVVLDAFGSVLHQESLPLVTNALALSADGDRLVVGDGASARLLAWTGAAFVETFRTPTQAGEVVARAAISSDGAIFALGWWDQVAGTGVRLQVWDGPSESLAFETSQSLPGAPLQNFPEAVAVTPDGRRAAFGLWGVGDSAPELLLVDVPTGAVVLQADLAGSVRALALDSTGTRVAVGMKHAHANQFATTGEVRLHDTGERDLQVVGGPLGGTLSLATRNPAAQRTLFLFGTPSSSPKTLPGALGSLWLQRSLPLRVFNRPADGSGRSDLTVIPSRIAGWVGWPFSVQAVARIPGGLAFTTTVLDPLGL